jgi:hypothetical protein
MIFPAGSRLKPPVKKNLVILPFVVYCIEFDRVLAPGRLNKRKNEENGIYNLLSINGLCSHHYVVRKEGRS